MLLFFEEKTDRTIETILSHIQENTRLHVKYIIFDQFIKDITDLIESNPQSNIDINSFFSKRYPTVRFSDPENLSHYLYKSFQKQEYRIQIAFEQNGIYLKTINSLSNVVFKDFKVVNPKTQNKSLIFFDTNTYLAERSKFSDLYQDFILYLKEETDFKEYLDIYYDIDDLKTLFSNDNQELYTRKK